METPKNEWKPEPAESFQIEYLNANALKNIEFLRVLGFRLTASGPVGEDQIYLEGSNADGTKIRAVITKGEGYKSPAQIAKEDAEAAAKKK